MTSRLQTSVYAGLVAGTVDIGSACVINHVMPGPVLRFIASGLLGSPLSHEAWVYVLGLLLQWAMSIVIAGIYVLIVPRLPDLARRPLSTGIAYGVVVYLVMTFVVVPLSLAKGGHLTFQSVLENLAAMLIFGLILAYMARWLAADFPASTVDPR